MRLVLSLAALLLASLALPALADTVPKLTKEEALQLFAAGGFPLKGQEVDNHCGQKANPSLTFTDMNGDGVDEAVFVDAGSCYPGGHWTAIVTKEGANWVPVLMAPATAQPVSHKTKGWYDVSVDFGTVKGVMQFDGTRYITGAAVPGNVTSSRKPKPAKRVKQPKVAVVPAPALSPVAPTPNAPKTRKDETLVTLGDKPTPAQAAAVKRAMHTEWAEVEQTEGHPVSYGVGEADLNGDGRPDLLLLREQEASNVAALVPRTSVVIGGPLGSSHAGIRSIRTIDAGDCVPRRSGSALRHDVRFGWEADWRLLERSDHKRIHESLKDRANPSGGLVCADDTHDPLTLRPRCIGIRCLSSPVHVGSCVLVQSTKIADVRKKRIAIARFFNGGSHAVEHDWQV